MSYIPREIVAEIKKMDALTYLKNYEPDELVSVGNETYTTKTHDSMRISNGLWNWFSRGIGGKNIGRNIKATGLYFLIGIVITVLFQMYIPIYHKKDLQVYLAIKDLEY